MHLHYLANKKIATFQSNIVLLVMPEFNKSLFDLFKFADLQFTSALL